MEKRQAYDLCKAFKFPPLNSTGEPVKIAEVHVRKMRSFINLLDMDGDGLLTRKDLVLLAENFIAEGKLDSEKAREAVKLRQRAWDFLFSPGDRDCKLDEKKLSEQLWRAGRERIISFISMNFCFAFDLIDSKNNGYITKEQLRQYHKIFNVKDERLTDESFRTMDVNKDGKISFIEFIEAGIDFFLSSDPNSPYNHLYGPLPE